MYNKNIYIKFMNQLNQTKKYKYKEIQKGEIFEVWYKSNQTKERKRIRKYIVITDLTEGKEEFSCICGKFSKDEIFCTHILKVIVEEEVKKIPDKYFLDRWRKTETNIRAQPLEKDTCTHELLRFNMVSRQGALLASKGAKKEIAAQYLCEEFKRIDRQLDVLLAQTDEGASCIVTVENTEVVSVDNPNRHLPDEIVVLKDPDRIQQKGRPKKSKRLMTMVEQEHQKMKKAEEKKKNKKPTNASKTKFGFIV
jgi:hypothetical protein